jgi:hypothetical protein
VDYWQATGSTYSLTTQVSPATVANLFGGTNYYLTVSAINGNGILAPSGIVLPALTAPIAPSTIGPSGGTVMAGGATLQFHAGAYVQNVQVSLQPLGAPNCSVSPVEAMTPTSVGFDVAVSPGIEPANSVLLTISYQDADLGTPNPNQFVIAHCDAATNNVWVPLATTVNTANMTLTAASSQLSFFQIMQAAPSSSVSQFKLGPNPLRPSRGQSQMNFVGPAGAEVRIYTVTGQLVKDLSLAADGTNYWDATNRAGQPVASGVYFVYVKGGGQNQTFKVIVER